MDTLGNEDLIVGFNALLERFGKEIRLAKDGATFSALVQRVDAMDPGAVLGPDIREADIIHTLRESVPSWLLAPDCKGQQLADCGGVNFKMTRREDNFANPFVDFQIVKLL